MADSPYPSQQQDKFVLRLPDGMRDRIRVAAEANGRSMNAEIVARLAATFQTPTKLLQYRIAQGYQPTLFDLTVGLDQDELEEDDREVIRPKDIAQISLAVDRLGDLVAELGRLARNDPTPSDD